MKNYILDTNVLLHDPNSLLAFKANTVLIPIEVIEEIDRFKTGIIGVGPERPHRLALAGRPARPKAI